MDDNKRYKIYLRWARICMCFAEIKVPTTIKIMVDNFTFSVRIWVESNAWVEKVDQDVKYGYHRNGRDEV